MSKMSLQQSPLLRELQAASPEQHQLADIVEAADAVGPKDFDGENMEYGTAQVTALDPDQKDKQDMDQPRDDKELQQQQDTHQNEQEPQLKDSNLEAEEARQRDLAQVLQGGPSTAEAPPQDDKQPTGQLDAAHAEAPTSRQDDGKQPTHVGHLLDNNSVHSLHDGQAQKKAPKDAGLEHTKREDLQSISNY